MRSGPDGHHERPSGSALLRSRGLPVSGSKTVLLQRLASAGVPVPENARPSAAAPSAPAVAVSSIASIPRDATPRASPVTTPCVRLATWNVAGLRALLRNERGVDSLRRLATDCDVVLLQETKLQEMHVASVEAELLDVLSTGTSMPWRAAWASSTARLGYAGVATLWTGGRGLGATVADAAICTPLTVDPGHEADREGRTLLLQLPLSPSAQLAVVNVYTPNSGAELQRLKYRTSDDGWDGQFRAALLRAQQAPPSAAGSARRAQHVCAGGDFNVAVGDADFFNPDEMRMAKQAGTTAEERASMRRYAEAPLFMTDAFRSCHPHATGQYTYWSQRARNRPRNRGLRLDYFLLSSSVMAADALRDVQHRHELEGSDHCPVVVELELGRL